jgi:predicted N-acetyltransferase YhbS
MTNDLSLRLATQDDIDWINSCYDDVGFVHSEPSNEIIVIAEVAGDRAGLGRLTRITHDDAELGGMLVFTNFRGHGIAGRIVEVLLEHSKSYKRVFCIPFSHLRPFYERYGFREFAPNVIEAPPKVKEKHNWCNHHYEQKTLLLALTNRHE